MAFIKRQWTATDADEWSKEDCHRLKLKVISGEYERRQHHYLEEFRADSRWKEDANG